MKKIMALLAAAVIGIIAAAQTTEKLSFVTKNNVNMRATPSPQGKVIGKAAEGMVFKTGKVENGWAQVIDPIGKTAYISTSMLDNIRPDEMKIYKATDILISQKEADEREYITGYVENKQGSGWETTEQWTFIGDKSGNNKKVKAIRTYNTTYATGRMTTTETYYSGELCGWYILLTEMTDYEGKVESKCDVPVVAYPAFSSNRGVFVDGEYFPDMSDTDNWD